jgi:hypothetical protein
MTDDITPATTAQISRRTMLGGTAGAVAAVWAAPAITSFGASAGAASVTCTAGHSLCTDGFVQCGASGPVGDCYCDTGIGRGATICAEDFFCGDPNHAACTSDADCPGGWICSTGACSGCDPSNGFCTAPCGTNVASAERTGKRNSQV